MVRAQPPPLLCDMNWRSAGRPKGISRKFQLPDMSKKTHHSEYRWKTVSYLDELWRACGIQIAAFRVA